MFKKLIISACTDITVRNLLELQSSGHSVYRSSHAGNWSPYKLLLSELGLPDCIWDVTCIYKDINNQPAFKIVGGKKISLLDESDMRIVENDPIRHLTAYKKPLQDHSQSLASFHINPLRKLFGGSITTQSHELIQYADNVKAVFAVIEKYYPEKFGRYVFPCGCMVKLNKLGANTYTASCPHNSSIIVNQSDLAESAFSTLLELDKLVFNPEGYTPKGGIVYSLDLAIVLYYLWSYWKFGNKTIYQLSGPDTINYVTKSVFHSNIEYILKLLGNTLPDEIIPEVIDAQVVPATLFRFGYPANNKNAKEVMFAHEIVRRLQPLRREYKNTPEILAELNIPIIKALGTLFEKGQLWDLYHVASRDNFYSQHDMHQDNTRMVVMDNFLDIPFSTLQTVFQNLGNSEQALIKQFLKQKPIQA